MKQFKAEPQTKATHTPGPVRWTLLPMNHPTYLRRMAKELSNRSAGFYHDGERWTQAHFAQGMLVITRVAGYSKNRTDYHRKSFADVSNEVFGDGNGGTINATRVTRP